MGFDRGTIHVDKVLTNIAVKYMNEEFIADKILPVVSVKKKTNLYTIFGSEHFRLQNDIKAKGVAANTVKSWSATTASYTCIVHALKDSIDKEDYANADAPITPQIEVTQGLTEMIKLRKEYATAAAIFNETTFASYLTTISGNDQWNNTSTSDPILAVSTASELIRKRIGRKPNTAVISSETLEALRLHPKLTNMFLYKPTKGALLTVEQVKAGLGVDTLFVGTAVYNSTAEGITASMTDIWGKYMLLYWGTRAPSLRTPSLGYTISWDIYGGNQGMRTRKWYEDDIEADQVEVATAYDKKIVCAAAGQLLKNVIA